MEHLPDLDEESVRQRAYEISQRADGGSPDENWKRAREELLNEQAEPPNEERASPPAGTH